MKKSIIFFSVLLVFASFASGVLECSVKSSCGTGEVALFSMFSTSGGHASVDTSGANAYGNVVCCRGAEGMSNVCDANSDNVTKLYQATNSHVEDGNLANYANKICLSAAGGIECNNRATCLTSETCVASVFQNTDSHIGNCSAFDTKICCKVRAYEPDLNCNYCNISGNYWDNSQLRCGSTLERSFVWESSIPVPNKFCCGDDAPNEKYVNLTCETGVCVSSNTDDSCCNDTTDCVYNGGCYSDINEGICGGTNNICVDVNPSSPDLEVCVSGKWRDPDTNLAACKAVNNTQNPAKWMTGAVCDKGDCNDATASVDVNFCCGDDENEVFREDVPNICSTSSQTSFCLYNGQYYREGGFIGDKYCQQGVWTSRTQLIATQLMNLTQQESPNDYVLFCDDFSSALNYVDYVVEGYTAANYFIGYLDPNWVCGGSDKPCVNNVCVLKLPNNKVVFGASLNQPIHQSPLPFIDTLTDAAPPCQDAANINNGQFNKCGGSLKVWYNNRTQSIIYSKSDLTNIGQINFWDTFLLFLKNPFQKIFNFLVKWLVVGNTGQNYDYSFINSTEKYSRIYLARNGLKTVRGITELVEGPKPGEYLSVQYNCFTDNITQTVSVIDKKIRGTYHSGSGGYSDRIMSTYNSSLGAYYVATNSSLYGLVLWPELTAKLRVKDTGHYPNTKVYAKIDAPSVTFSGQPVTFKAIAEGCNQPFEYSWEFVGDGQTGSGESITHTYSSSTEVMRQVILKVNDSSSPKDQAQTVFNIRVVPDVDPVIPNKPTSIIAGQKTVLSVAGPFDIYRWDITLGSQYCSVQTSGDTKSINLTGNIANHACKVKVSSVDFPSHFDETGDISIVPAIGNLTCNVVAAAQCVGTGKSILFKISDTTNAHAQTTGSYGYAVCCELPGGTLTVGASGEEVVSLSDLTDAHVAVDGTSYRNNIIKISSQDVPGFNCRYGQSHSAGEACVVSVSGTTNAHVGNCTAYATKVYCGTGTANPPPIPNSCSGTPASNSVLCTGDDLNVPAGIQVSLVDSCTANTKCEYTCNSGYHNSSGVCVPNTCLGNPIPNAAICSDDDLNVPADTSIHLVSSCTTDKCEYTCNLGYHRNGEVCVPDAVTCAQGTATFYSNTNDGHINDLGNGRSVTVDTTFRQIALADGTDSSHEDYKSTSYLAFDTSSLPDNAVISSARLELYPYFEGPDWANTNTEGTLRVYYYNWDPTLEASDRLGLYQKIQQSETPIGIKSTNQWVRSGSYNQIGLNNFIGISNTGDTYFGLGINRINPQYETRSRADFSPSESANKPKLVVDYTCQGSTTFYGTANDGYVQDIDGYNDGLDTLSSQIIVFDKITTGGNGQTSLGALGFDTSLIPDNAVITSAKLYLFGADVGMGAGIINRPGILSVRQYPWGPTLGVDDWLDGGGGDIPHAFGATMDTKHSNDWQTNAYNELAFTDMGRINKAGMTYLGLLAIHDSPSAGYWIWFGFDSQDSAADKRPKLVVTYTLP